MKASAELHPEEMLERDARGELSDREHELLGAHLRRCPACRIERQARLDFADEVDPTGTPGLDDVQPLLAKVLAMQPVDVRLPMRAARRGRRLLPLLVAAALVSAVAGAAVAVRTGLHVRGPLPPARPPPSPALVSAPGSLPTAHAVDVAVSAEPPEPAHSATPGAVPQAVTFVDRTAPEPASPASSFDRANSARRSGDHLHAAELYRALIARYPHSAEARASLVSLGRMQLDDGDASGALRAFDDYLAGGGSLGEDATLGRALALRRLGRAGEEAQAWSALVREYPRTAHADRARQRLLDLGAL